MEKKLYDLNIDEEFEKLIPPLQNAELLMLTASIRENGCEMPLVIWNRTILDGHNRYRICRENNIPFEIKEKEFEDKDAAKIWVIQNQLARRNLPSFVKCELVLPLQDCLREEGRKRQGWRRASNELLVKSPKGEAALNTRAVLAAMAGVSEKTLEEVKKISELADEETKEKLRRGEMSIHSAYTGLNLPKKQRNSQKSDASDNVPSTPEPEVWPEPNSVDSPPPKKQSLLTKPIFGPEQMPHLDAPILFQPVVRDDEPEDSNEDFDDDEYLDDDDLAEDSDDGGNTVLPSDPLPDADTSDSPEAQVWAIFDDLLRDLDIALDGFDKETAERILDMVREAGGKAALLAKEYTEEMRYDDE